MNKMLIEKVTDIIPSRDLKKYYNESILNGIYPEWTEEDCLAVVNMCCHNISEAVLNYKNVISLIENAQIKESINKYIKELMHKGRQYRYDRVPSFIEKYVKIKTLYSGGELVSRWWNGKKLHAVVEIRDYDGQESKLKDHFDYTDAAYLCLDIGDWDVDFDNPYDIFGSHSHPAKVDVERAELSELSEKEKIYYDVIMNRYLHCDEKKVFEEYDRKHGKL